jgi:3-oxoadipate enol-lactonase
MLGQAFAIEYQQKLISAMWCDTLPASPSGAKAAWDERMGIVRKANSLEPIADATMERWFTDAFKAKNPRRWKQIRDTIAGTTPAGYLGCSSGILDFDFTRRLPSVKAPVLVVCGSEDPGTPAPENKKLAGLVPGARYEEIAGMKHFPNVEAPDAFNRIMLGWLEQHKRAS